MTPSIFIAKKYLHTSKKRKIIHLMSIVAFVGIVVSTTSLLLSNGVYNGLEGLIMDVLKSIDYDIKISLAKGKNFSSNKELLQRIQKIDGVESVAEVMETNVMLINGTNSTVACLRGVHNYGDTKTDRIQKHLLVGKYEQENKDKAIIGSGIAYLLGINYHDQLIEIRHLNRLDKRFFMPLSKPYNSKNISISGIFSIDKQNDEKFIISSLEFAQALTKSYDRISSIEVNIAPNTKTIISVQKAIKHILADDNFQVKTIDEQQATLMQAIRIEKLCTRFTFIILMLIAALNIFFALGILTIIKKKDIYTLYTLGATRDTIAKIFITLGLILSIRGAAIGSILAYTLAWVQQRYGIVSLGASIASVDAYPVDMHWSDFFYTVISVISITLLASWLPARWSRKFLHQQSENN